jgi:peptidoglycan/xylan/chitin deacetylase (PgdA/CDA1 family)
MLVGLLLGKRPLREWYRFLYDYCYWEGVRRAVPDRSTWKRFIRGTVILVYHACGGQDEPPRRFIVPATRFARQMAWLKCRQYHILSLEAFMHCRREDRLPPERSVVITFDDGYADNRAIAYPILRQYDFPATIFLVSQSVGTSNLWDSNSELTGRPLLSGADIQAMKDHDIDFGSHTKSHVSLTSVPIDRVKDEVKGSRLDLEHEVRSPIRTFAYPYGKNDLVSRSVVERAGFLGACSFQSGANDHTTSLYALRRTEIRGTDSLVRFVLALWLGGTRLKPRPRDSWRGQP